MATVHRAIERGVEGFERVVALKRLLPHLAEDEEFVRAFVREAKLASLLRHGSIVQIYELGRVAASYFISMEYIPGRDLRVILRQARRVCGPPPIEVALSLLNELLQALDHAHRQRGPDGRALGIVHRDISPSNLLISHTGHLKVIDFGIAKATIGHLMTNTGRVKGKLSYMAPEALAGQLDARSDLFSASVIAHELLTATPLFASKEDLQTVEKLQNMQPPPPSQKNPSCPPELDEIVLRGLAKDPADRWQSASEMRAALVELASGRYRLASKREVCHWIEEAFEMQAPSRRRMPLTAPGGVSSRPAPTASAEDDELMDMVWGGSGPSASQPVVLDEVPDVSARISGVHPIPMRPPDAMELLGAEPDLEEPTSDMLRPVELAPPAAVARSRTYTGASQSSTKVPTISDVFSLSGTPSAVSWQSTRGRPTSRPPEWAFGTSGTTGPQANSGLLEQSIADARRPLGGISEPATPTTPPRKRAPLLPVLAAAVAVAGAGAAIAWLVSMRPENDSTRPVAADGQQKVVAAQLPPPAVRSLPDDTGAAGTPEPPAAQPGAAAGATGSNEVTTENQVITDKPDADKAAAEAEAREKADEKARLEAKARADKREEKLAREERLLEEEERESKSRKGRQTRVSKRDAAEARARAGADADEESEEPEDEAEERVATAQTTRSSTRAADAPGAKATRSIDDQELEPLPVPVTEPAEPPRPKKPVIITPDRAIRQSGSVPRLRFPPWEQAPAAVAYKLCVDASGAVSSVTVLSKLSSGVRAAVIDGLKRWRYKPVLQAGQKVSACFATTFKVELK
jgi:serine/threonine protein kinase